MIYGSVCSGIEAATVAWHPLGWRPAFFAEVAKFPSQVLGHHYPAVPNHGDFTTINQGDYDAIDVLVGGTPCQDFSVAGLRAGMDGARGQLTVEFAHLAGRLRPEWLVWENVPGVLSIDGGRAFGTFLGMLGQLGYGLAYRVLDAQHFGVPQRRRRVFVVGYFGDWRRAAAVLFERHSLSGDPAPRREAGQTAPTVPSRSTGGGGLGTDFDCDGGLIASTGHVSHCLNGGGMGRQDFETETLLAVGGFPDSDVMAIQGAAVRENPASGPDGIGVRTDGVAFTLEARSEVQAIAFTCKDHGADASALSPTLRAMGHSGSHANAGGQVAVAMNLRGRDGGAMPELSDVASLRAADGGSSRSYVAGGMAVRRLTPRECERLQGFPDDYTKLSDKTADGPRYKALGNSMAVPVMRWIGERIAMVDAIKEVAA